MPSRFITDTSNHCLQVSMPTNMPVHHMRHAQESCLCHAQDGAPLSRSNFIIFTLHILQLMTGVNFVMNDKGEKTALLIDFAVLKQEGKTENDVMEFMEDLEDILAVELSKKENDYSDWEDAKQRLKAKGIID
jgi:hypothetical protein